MSLPPPDQRTAIRQRLLEDVREWTACVFVRLHEAAITDNAEAEESIPTKSIFPSSLLGLVSQMGDAEFLPNPCEVVGGHWVIRIVLRGLVFEQLEPRNEFAAALLRSCGPARRDISERRNWLIKLRAIVPVHGVMDYFAPHIRR